MKEKHFLQERAEVKLPNRIKLEPPTEEELQKMTNILNLKKAPGRDGVPLHFYKIMLGDKKNWINHIWSKEIHDSVFIGKLCAIPKPGCETLSDGFRPIVIQNLKAKIIEARFKPYLEEVRKKMRNNWQTGFLQGKSTFDNLGELKKRLMRNEKCIFIDFKSAFCSIRWECILKPLQKYLDPKIFSNVRHILCSQGYAIGKKIFKPDRGTPQGGILSPDLLNIGLGYVIQEHTNIKDNEIRAYADDIVLFYKKTDRANQMLEQMFKMEGESGLRINKEKSGFSHINTDLQNKWEIAYKPNYLYLGVPLAKIKTGEYFGKYLKILTKVIHKGDDYQSWTLEQRERYINDTIMAKMGYQADCNLLGENYKANSLKIRLLISAGIGHILDPSWTSGCLTIPKTAAYERSTNKKD